MNGWRRWKMIAGVLALGWTAGAWAQAPGDNAALAESLFRHAKKLMQEGSVAEACAKFAESYRLDPTLGTLLNLAVCHEQQGRTATAWAELNDAAARATRAGERDRATFAREHADALERRLSHVTIRVVDATPGLEVRLDDRVLGPAAWATPMPVDPGPHEVAARAPGRQPWSRTVTVATGPSSDEAVVPALSALPVAAVAPVAPPIVVAPAVTEAPAPGRSTGRLVAGWSAATVGVAGIAVGTYFGLRTLDRQKVVERECTGSLCSPTGLTADHDAHVAARWSNVGFGVGLVGLGTAAYLLWWSSPSPSHTAWQVLPVAFDGPGITAGRRW